jgi:hypothetical protein
MYPSVAQSLVLLPGRQHSLLLDRYRARNPGAAALQEARALHRH